MVALRGKPFGNCIPSNENGRGAHTVCAVMTAEFLAFSKSSGNDLSTPVPEFGCPTCGPAFQTFVLQTLRPGPA